MKGKKLLALLLAAALCLSLTAAAYASEEPAEPAESPAFDGEAVEGEDYGEYTYGGEYWFANWEGLCALLEEHAGDPSLSCALDEEVDLFTFEKDLDIPSNVMMDLYMADEVVIPAGVTVKCSSYLYVGAMTVNGTLELGENGTVDYYDITHPENVLIPDGVRAWLTKYMMADSEAKLLADMAEAEALPNEHFWSFIFLSGDWSIDHSLTVPVQMEWQAVDYPDSAENWHSSHITVGRGAVLTLEGVFYQNSGTLSVEGKLVNNGRLSVYAAENATADFTGGSYAGSGRISVMAGPGMGVSDILIGLDMTPFEAMDYSNYPDGSWEAWYRPAGDTPVDPGGPDIDLRVPTVYLAAYILSQDELPDFEAVRTLRAVIGKPMPDE